MNRIKTECIGCINWTTDVFNYCKLFKLPPTNTCEFAVYRRAKSIIIQFVKPIEEKVNIKTKLL